MAGSDTRARAPRQLDALRQQVQGLQSAVGEAEGRARHAEQAQAAAEAKVEQAPKDAAVQRLQAQQAMQVRGAPSVPTQRADGPTCRWLSGGGATQSALAAAADRARGDAERAAAALTAERCGRGAAHCRPAPCGEARGPRMVEVPLDRPYDFR